jgi:hypothetical protein
MPKTGIEGVRLELARPIAIGIALAQHEANAWDLAMSHDVTKAFRTALADVPLLSG